MQYITLNNDVRMPAEGLGTFLMSPREAEDATLAAIRAGYRHIDTANGYYNEAGVARGIRRSGIPREQVFVSTKLWPSGYTNAAADIDKTLARMGLDYIDMLILHQPCGDYLAAWKDMEDAYRAGKVRALGMSNMFPDRLMDFLMHTDVKPVINQVRTNPYWQQKDANRFMRENGVVHEAHSPFSQGSGEILESIRAGHVAYIINTREIGEADSMSDGLQIRRCATENNATIFTSLDTVRVLLDVLEETTLTISTIDA